MTVAAFMDLALYDPRFGYYARASRRSGRAGDFFTSVDVGPLFGELLELQLAEMVSILHPDSPIPPVDFVEAGAGNGRLSADIVRVARRLHPELYDAMRLQLVEASAVARADQLSALSEVADRLTASTDRLPERFDGVLLANELLDALPTHQVVMREDGLREVYVEVDDGDGAPGALIAREGPPSTPKLARYLEDRGVKLEPGWRVEVNLRAVEWICNAACRLGRGFIILIDYGHEAPDLYSPLHADGTLTSFTGHTASGPGPSLTAPDRPAWLQKPGEQDITAHVDFTSIRVAAEAAGLTTIGFLDQTYFLMGLLSGSRGSRGSKGSGGSGGSAQNHLNALNLLNLLNPSEQRALKTLLMPGGLGSTHKVMIFGKGVGTPALAGCSYRMRVT